MLHSEQGLQLEEHLLGRPLPSDSGIRSSVLQASLTPPDLRSVSCQAMFCLLALASLLVASTLITYHLIHTELWLVFALVAPVTWLGGHLFKTLQTLIPQVCQVVVSLKSNGCKWDRCLMEALVAELRKERVSCRAEVIVENGDEDDEGKSRWLVALLPLLVGAQLVLAGEDESLMVEVTLEQKDPIICGRAQEPRRSDSAYLTVHTASLVEMLRCGMDFSGQTAALLGERQQRALSLLVTWLQFILEQFTKQKAGQVEVYELQEEYKDYRLGWELIRRECCCGSQVTGLAHYSNQIWSDRIRRQVDFALGHGGRARLTLFLSGPKGSGKTFFVEWLAGELKVPVYYIDLRSPGITDAVLRDAVARNRLKHCPPVLFHLDEFQAPLRQWISADSLTPSADVGRVTIQGLQSMLEGISTPNSAVFIFTSSIALPSLDQVHPLELRHELQGLLRRFQCVVSIPSLDRSTAESFMRGFLSGYVSLFHMNAMFNASEWTAFSAAWRNWEEQVCVPFDMLSKYAEQAVRDFYVDGVFPQVSTSNGSVLVGVPRLVQEFSSADNSQVQISFLRAVLNPAAVRAFANEYAGGAYSDSFRS